MFFIRNTFIILLIVIFAVFDFQDNSAKIKKNPREDDSFKYKNTSERINSLKAELRSNINELRRIDIINEISSYSIIFPDSTLFYANYALKESENADYKKGTAQAHINLGTALVYKAKLDEALSHFEKSFTISKDNNLSQEECNSLVGLADTYSAMRKFPESKKYYLLAFEKFAKFGTYEVFLKGYTGYSRLLQKMGENESAIEYMIKALNIAKDNADELNILRAYSNLANLYHGLTNYSAATENYKKALNIAEEIKDSILMTKQLGNLGIISFVQGDYPKALEYYEWSMGINLALKNKVGYSMTLGNVGVLYRNLNNAPKALEYFEKAQAIYEELGMKRDLSINLGSIGNVCYDMKNYKKALDCYTRALKYAEELDDKTGISRNLSSLANIFSDMRDYQKAIEYYEKATQVAGQSKDKRTITYQFLNMGFIHYEIAIDSSNKDTSKIIDHLRKAIDYQEKAALGFKEMGEINGLSQALLAQSNTFMELKDYKNAIEKYKSAKAIQDSIFSSDNQKKIAELEVKKDLEIKQKENDVLKNQALLQKSELLKNKQEVENLHNNETIQNLQLEKQNLAINKKNNELSLLEKDKKFNELEIRKKEFEKVIIIISSIIAFSAILIFLFIAFKIREKRRKYINEKQLLKSQLQALRLQMNPHFIFNTINSILYLINKQDNYNATEYLTKLSKLMRMILENSHYHTISLAEEIDSLRLYLELESLRFENKFEFNISLSDKIDSHETQIPTMLIQPYVENALIHGLLNKQEAGSLQIEFDLENDVIKTKIIDNGIGREKASEFNKSKTQKHKSLGMSVTKERLNLLNSLKDKSINEKITDLKDDNNNPSGTLVELFIPIDLN